MSANELISISSENKALYRRRMERDPWYFIKYVCNHAERAVERIHRPLLYLYTRQAALLAATLSDPRFDGYLTSQVRADFTKHGIDWNDPAHLPRISKRLRKQNIRLPRGIGKALATDTPIPTPDGWKFMADLAVGDYVFDERGQQTKVVATSETWEGRPCYRVTFSDGEVIVCDEEHLWTVSDRFASKNPKTLRTADMVDRVVLSNRRGWPERRYTVPVAPPIKCWPVSLAVDPYVLGAWLGDGTSACGNITTADPEIVEAIRGAGYEVREVSAKYRWSVIGLLVKLRALGVLDDKHIPREYLRAPAPERLALLQGLMDTDGSIAANGHCEITLKATALADDLAELLSSLGLKFGSAIRYINLDGKRCGPYIRFDFKAFDDMPVFRLSRKRERLVKHAAYSISRTRTITEIVTVDSQPVRCIQVANESGLYLAGRKMVPTHNSTMADDGNLWEATMDPNLTISIGTKGDTYAWERIASMGQVILSPAYAFWFPERVPSDPKRDVTKTGITLAGRTNNVPEATIEGRGIKSPWTGRHYRINRRDDIVGTESGDASLDDAKLHMANIDALHDETGWQCDIYIGTINGENDDHSMLADDESFLTIVMPIEEHEGGTTLENVYEDGVLTVPEWWDRERVNDIKANAKKNTEHGPIYLLQNYYMTAHKSGVSMFTSRMLNRAMFEWHFDEGRKRELIVRPKKGFETIAFKDLKPSQKYVLDLKTLPRTAFALGIDQSVAAGGASDQWSMTCVCVDSEGVYYVLDNIADHGYAAMLDEIVPFDRKSGFPGKIGIDSNATQGMTVEWLKRAPEFKDIARRVEGVRSNNESKDINIRNWLQGRMLSGGLYINPRLNDLLSEMLRYRPRSVDGRKKKNAVDNRLDATWMAMTLPIVPPSEAEMEEMNTLAMLNERYESRHTDRMTGVSTDNWMDALPHWSAA